MAMAVVGGAFLSSALNVLFDRMASREVSDFIRRQKLDDLLFKNLRIKLMAVNAVLNDAEEKQITNPAVKEWLDELKDAVYSAEDLLDEIATEALRCQLEVGSQSYRTQVRDFISTSLNPFGEGVNTKIKKIIQNIEYIAKQKDLLGLREGVRGKLSLSLPTTSLVDEFGAYGRDDEKEKITKLLLSDDASGNGTCVIAIVGMGGVGKTTLAQLLYNDEKVNEYFDMKAWVCVSEEHDVSRITKTVLESVDSQARVNDDLNSLQVKLRESLMEKKFLLVLDDIWNESYSDWNNLRIPFSAGAKGSKIIVTTRNRSVASIMCTVPVYNLEQLSYEACWLLFTKHAFGNVSVNVHLKLEEIGKKIVEKCKGLPLAVKTLGGLLHSKLDAKEWNDVLESKIWDLPNEQSKILPALRLSYHYLPTHLKQCFAYCSIFPKDYAFKKEKLVLLWIAEGFVQQPESKKRMEEVGDDYFRELSSRSFFQQSHGDKSSFVMHDLINDLAQFVSGKFSYRLEDDKPLKVAEKVRHFSYLRGKFDSYKKFGPFHEVKCLRTFLPFSAPSGSANCCLTNKVPNDMLPTQSCLRVLSLSRYKNITELPDSIGNLKLLRYLDLSQTAIRRLPEVICTLYNLQALMLSDCHFLTELPANIGKLGTLRHLDINRTNLTEMPVGMSELKSLQTLTTFIVGKENGLRVEVLREFRHLRGRLSISNLQNVVNAMDASEANLKDKEYVDELLLEWGSETDDSLKERDVLDKLQPSTSLKKLIVKGYGGTSFPHWLGDSSFSNIAVLRLSDCKYCTSLPPLGRLPSLIELSIVRINYVERVGLEFYEGSNKPFQKLKTLRFEGMLEWAEWSSSGVEGGVFPRLQVLLIKNCPKLRGDLPNCLPLLKKLVISDCPKFMVSIPRDTSIRYLELHGCHEVVLSSVVDLTSLKSLYITSHTQVDQQLETMPSLLHALTSLKRLETVGYTSLLSSPKAMLPSMLESLRIHKCEALESLPEEMIHSCTRLRRLSITECPYLKSFPRGGLSSTLKILSIENCKQLELFPLEAEEKMPDYYASLESLSVDNSCDSLKSFPLALFPKLNDLRIEHCKSLESLRTPKGLHEDLTFLTSLRIWRCAKLVSFPEGGLPTPNLTVFEILSCENLTLLPSRMHTLLPTLQTLVIMGCPELESFPEGGLPSNLVSLAISSCDKLTACRKDWGLRKLASLKTFSISGCKQVVESFPEEWLLPSTLTSISISKCPNLKYLDNRGIQHLTSLQQLKIRDCPNLHCLPEVGLPTSLSLLDVWGSPLLKQCEREKGKDWPSILPIPNIVMEGKLIS